MKDILLNKTKYDRNGLLDSLRGLTVLSMILYHGMWDVYHLFEVKAEWFRSTPGFLWQQMICWTFLILSGFCAAMGRKTIQRGLTVWVLGFVISVITVVFMPQDRILFGVLTLIGSSMILSGLLKPMLLKIPAAAGFCVSFLLFLLTRGINRGYVGFLFEKWQELPVELYRNYLTTYLGFPFKDFYSTDYFSLIPWLFLFLAGFYLYGIFGKRILAVKWKGNSVFNGLGRHALLVYMLHQPILYGLMVFMKNAIV